MIKICFLADATSIHTIRWCNYFIDNNYQVEVISFKNSIIEGVKVHFVNAGKIDVKGGNWKVLIKVGKIKKLLKIIKPNILHAHYATSYGIVGALTKFKPFVITTLGSDILISAKNSKIYRALVKFALKRANHVTAMAEHMKTAIHNLGVLNENISTVMFGIDPLVFNMNNYKINASEFLIVSTRNFEPIYNHQLFFNALALLPKEITDIKIVLVGEGSVKSTFETFANEKLTHLKIEFLGKVPQLKIVELLNKANLFVTTALSDGNCVSLNEAMACGAFAIAGSIDATKVWIENGVNGFLVPLDAPEIMCEKIVYVREHYNELISNAHKFNEKIITEKALWTVNMKRVENLYNVLLNKN